MNDTYIDMKKIAAIKGLKSTRSIRIAIQKGKYVAREIKVNGGTSYEILYSSLEPELQEKLEDEEIKTTSLVPIENKTNFISKNAKMNALARVDIVTALMNIRNKYPTKKEADDMFLDLYNSGMYLPQVYKFVGSISIGTLHRWVKAYENYGTRIFQYYDARIIDILIRAFCSEIPSCKAAQISGLEERTTEKIYTIFRAAIYAEQKHQLDIYYKQKPQIARHRMFFEKEAYMYIYNRQVFISKHLLKSKADKTLNQKDKAEFTTIYCYLTRNLTHNKNAYNLECKIAETLWHRNKEFSELYKQLIKLVNG